jgi:hypothetical protein
MPEGMDMWIVSSNNPGIYAVNASNTLAFSESGLPLLHHIIVPN